jgi:hypothetical protein
MSDTKLQTVDDYFAYLITERGVRLTQLSYPTWGHSPTWRLKMSRDRKTYTAFKDTILECLEDITAQLDE